MAATDPGRVFHGVVVIGAERARALRQAATPIRASELIGLSGEFHAGDWLYVTSRGHDGGQSALATGAAAIDSDRLDDLDAQATVIDGLQLLWGNRG